MLSTVSLFFCFVNCFLPSFLIPVFVSECACVYDLSNSDLDLYLSDNDTMLFRFEQFLFRFYVADSAKLEQNKLLI